MYINPDTIIIICIGTGILAIAYIIRGIIRISKEKGDYWRYADD